MRSLPFVWYNSLESEVKNLKAYHIDRKNILIPNKIVDLDTSIKIDPDYLQSKFEDDFPEGVSKHGDQYFASVGKNGNLGNYVYEAVYEYERKLRFPDKISRYQAFFGIETMNDLRIWLNFFTKNNISAQKKMTIWEIDTLDSVVQEFDASYIGGGDLNALQQFSQLTARHYSEKYWSGEMSDSPLKELLISPKVKILRRVKFSEIF